MLLLAAYVPQLLTKPGAVTTDTKTYLFLDPGKVLGQSVSMWNPNIGLGTVTHEAIGYLWPMGPFFWLSHAVGIPVWAAQRLWIGTLLFAAGTGILFLCRVIGLRDPGRLVAAGAFMFSPYVLQYVGRISVLLLPWAGLGWLLGVAILALRHRGWRYPALVALVWLTIVGTDPVGAMYAAVAVLLWVGWSIATHRHSPAAAWAMTWRTGVLTIAVSVWWLVAFLVEGHFGLNVLLYTEQPSHIANASLASEVVRGLGYWFYYGYDAGGPWAATWAGYSQHLWQIVASFGVPVAGLAAAVAVRWRLKSYFVLLTTVALVLAVSAHPYATPSLLGAILKFFTTHSNVGLALRSTNRAAPGVVLGLTILLGSGVTALARRRPRLSVPVTVLCLGMVAAANPAMWDASTVLLRYTMRNPLPHYTTQAAARLNAEHRGTRVLAIPGQNTAAYTWGDTIDPIWPGLLDRPFVNREQFPLGSLPTYDMLYAFDNPMQNGTLDPTAIAPFARLFSAGDILVQNDLNSSLFGQPQPQVFWQSLQPTPKGLGAPVGYGKRIKGVPSLTRPYALEAFPVIGPRPILRGESAGAPVVVDGDAVGLESIAGTGLLDTQSPILYAGNLKSPSAVGAVVSAPGSTLVVTDSNRKQIFLWSRIQGNAGQTLSAQDPSPATPLDIFGHSTAAGQTTSSLVGVASVSGVPNGLQSSPAMALDGIPETAWRTQASVLPQGRWWQVRLTKKVAADRITLAQASSRDYEVYQWITKVGLSFDGGPTIERTLGTDSRTRAGQVVTFPRHSFRTLRITIERTNLTGASDFRIRAASSVGLAEVGIPGIHAERAAVMPSDLLSAAGQSAQARRLVVVMTRNRATQAVPEADPEPTLTRSFFVPAARAFALSGTARIDSSISEQAGDAIVGRADIAGQVTSAYSSQRLSNSLRDSASATLDGNTATSWSPGLGSSSQRGAWIQVNLPAQKTLDHLDLTLVADGLHSLPRRLEIRACQSVADGGSCQGDSEVRTVQLPEIRTSSHPDATRTIHLNFPSVSGRDFTFAFRDIRLAASTNPYTLTQIGLPLKIAELGIPGVRVGAPRPSISTDCRSDLLTIDNRPLSVRISGATQNALSGNGLAVTPCGADASGVALSAGDHIVRSTFGAASGFDVDQVAFDSAAGGGASPAGSGAALAAPVAGTAPSVTVVHQQATKIEARVQDATRPFWLVLGQSLNPGWHLRIDGRAVTQSSQLVDGFANGWKVDPAAARAAGGDRASKALDVTLTWAPQQTVDVGVLLSAAGGALCLAIVMATRRRRPVATASPSASAAASPVAGAGALATDADDPEPSLAAGAAGHDRKHMAPLQALAVAAALALGGMVFVPGPLLAAGVFVLVFLGALFALLNPDWQVLLRVAAAGFAGAAVLYTAVQQAIHRFPPAGWLAHFEHSSDLIWFAVVFLCVDTAVSAIGRRRGTAPPVEPARAAPAPDPTTEGDQ